MDSKQRKTIAFVLSFTFLLGLGSGYLIRGVVQTDPHGMLSVVSADKEQEQSPDARERRPRPDTSAEPWREGRGSDRYGAQGPGPGYGSDRQENASEARPGSGRMRTRLMRDLNLTETEAGEFMELLSRHRDEGQKVFSESRRRLHGELQILREALERDVAEFLDEEQLQLWRERYAPRQQSGPPGNRTER
jgi:hypothetical protein